MEVLRKAPDPIFDSNLILDFLDFGDDDDDKKRWNVHKVRVGVAGFGPGATE